MKQSMIIKRIRNFYLYDEKGNRYLDFSLGNGGAVLGHKPSQVSKKIKQALDKGVWTAFPSRKPPQVVKYLNNYMNNWFLQRITYLSPHELITASTYTEEHVNRVYDITVERAHNSTNSMNISDLVFWRPYAAIDIKEISDEVRFCVTIIPLPWGQGIFAVFGRIPIPHTQIVFEVSPVILEGISHLIPHMLVKGYKERPVQMAAKNRKDIYVMDTVSQPRHAFSYATLSLPEGWKQQGVYIIVPEYTHSEYSKTRQLFLDKGFYFPEYDVIQDYKTLVCPQIMTKKEITAWNSSLF